MTVSPFRRILTVFISVAVALLLAACPSPTSSNSDGSDGGGSGGGGGGGGGDGGVITAPQVTLSGTVTSGSVSSLDMDSLATTQYMLVAVDENGNTTTAIVSEGDTYELPITRDVNTAIVVFDFPSLELIGLLQGPGGTRGMFSLGTNAGSDLVRDDTDNSVFALSNTGIAVEDGNATFPDDGDGGIDTTQLASDSDATVDYITLTDFIPRPGTWSLSRYEYSGAESGGTYSGSTRDIELTYSTTEGRALVTAEYYDYLSYNSSGSSGSWGGFWGGTDYDDVDDLAVAPADPDADNLWTYRSDFQILPEDGSSPARIVYGAGDETTVLPISLRRGESFEASDEHGTDTITLDGIIGSIETSSGRDLPVLSLTVSGDWGSQPSFVIGRYGTFFTMDQANPTWSQVEDFINENVRLGTFTGDPESGADVQFAGTGSEIPGPTNESATLRNNWLSFLWTNRESLTETPTGGASPEEVEFNASGIESAYEDWTAEVLVYDAGLPPSELTEDQLVAIAWGDADADETVTSGEVGPLFAVSSADYFSPWIGETEAYDVYVLLTDPDDGSQRVVFTRPTAATVGPVATITGGTAQEVHISVPVEGTGVDDAVYQVVPE